MTLPRCGDSVFERSRRSGVGSLRARLRRGGSLVIRDPRRLGGVELDPDGPGWPDGQRSRSNPSVRSSASSAPLKARLMDRGEDRRHRQSAGRRHALPLGTGAESAANSLSDHEQAKLRRSMRRTIEILGARGGSHTGDLQVERKRGGVCPRCPTVELRRRHEGSHTYWCADCRRPEPTSTGAPVTVTVRYGRRAMSGLHRVRSLLVAVFVVSVLGAGAPVAAQVDSNGAEDDVFDANETESDRCDPLSTVGYRRRYGCLLVVYVWHGSGSSPTGSRPSSLRRRLLRPPQLEDMFVLPGEIDDEQPADTRAEQPIPPQARARAESTGGGCRLRWRHVRLPRHRRPVGTVP